MNTKLCAAICILILSAPALSATPAASAPQSAIAGSARSTSSTGANVDAPAVMASPESAPAGVNPMTGRTLRYEEMERQLRERTVEARIADQDLAIAKSRSEQRKLSAPTSSEVIGRVPDSVRNFPTKAEPVQKREPTAQKKVAARTAKQEPIRPLPPVPYVPPRYVGMMAGPDQKVALVSHGGRTIAVKEGTSVAGLSVSGVSADTAVINGVPTSIERATSTINLPATHQPVQPGALTPAAAPQQPTRGVVVQGVNAPAVQPLAPGAAITAASTQPVRFPADLYNR